MSGLVLHNYFRSSTSIRVRVALNLKGLDYAYVAHHLRRGEQRSAAYRAVNRQMLVPSLELGEGTVLTQSLAIMEYLDEVHPQPPLLPAEPVARPGCAPSPRRSPAKSIRSTICACSMICAPASAPMTRRWPTGSSTGWRNLRTAGRNACRRRPSTGRVLPWRAAGNGGCLPLRAGDQQPALRRRHDALPDDPAGFSKPARASRLSCAPPRRTSRTRSEPPAGLPPRQP